MILQFKNNKFYIPFAIAILFQSCYQQTTSSCANISTPNISCAPVLDTFTDNRDGRVYQTVTICNQTWMAENLQYDVPNNLTYTYYTPYDTIIKPAKDTVINGRIRYNYEAAIQICPNGWHLPSELEWQTLELNLGLNPNDTIVGNVLHDYKFIKGCGIVHLLMSTNGWNGSGTNASGFNLIGPDIEELFTSHNYECCVPLGGRVVYIMIKTYDKRYDYIQTREGGDPIAGCRCIKN